ncbi:MAG: maleylpyruvate isomerase N-terminal domain-containing protein [Pseudonocardiaceae bacterium]
MTFVDLQPATRRMADLINGVRDDQLGGPTPCPAYSLGDLLDHVGGLTLAFTAAAWGGMTPGRRARAAG